MMVTGKRCTKCGEVKGLGDFPRSAKGALGFDSRCKECAKRYRTENAEAIAAWSRRYQAENPEISAAGSRRYQAENPEICAARSRRYRAENAEAIAEYKRRYNAKHVEAISERARRYRAENSEALTRVHVRGVLSNGSDGIKSEQVSHDLIALKRESIFIYRALRQLTEIQNDK